MALRAKFILMSGALVLMLAGFGTIVVVNLWSAVAAARAASAEYETMDRAAATSNQVGWLRDALRGTGGARDAGVGTDRLTYRDPRFLDPMRAEVERIRTLLLLAAGSDSGDAVRQRELASELTIQFGEADRLSRAATTTPPVLASQLDLMLQTLGTITRLSPDAARRHVVTGTDRLVQMLEWSCAWLVVGLVVSVVIHYRQYRALVRPLVWLRDEMRNSAARQHEPLPEGGPSVDAEYRELARHYNSLARELSALYRDLEQKVIARSRQLVRSERLASVGYLAAGVAHEINNPLGIISGYSELSAKVLHDLLDGDAGREPGATGDGSTERNAQREAEAIAEVLDAQRFIREESFRCKEITSRLLSLARGGSQEREELALDEVVKRVVGLTHGLRQFRDRRISVEVMEARPFVMANLTELKQVLLNLAVNALEAVSPSVGEVRVIVGTYKQPVGMGGGGGPHSGVQWAEVRVEDNGKGMSAEMVEQVFEPFFTAKRGSGEPGTGLGLSITHAIVESHGGYMFAESPGPGLGSRFVMRLPAVRSLPGEQTSMAAS